jgi:hypothetical protein
MSEKRCPSSLSSNVLYCPGQGSDGGASLQSLSIRRMRQRLHEEALGLFLPPPPVTEGLLKLASTIRCSLSQSDVPRSDSLTNRHS